MKQGKKVAAIILSTHASTVMPGKSGKIINGMTVLEHIAGRLKRIPFIENICLATTRKEYDDNLCKLATKIGIKVYRGSANDLISRMHGAAKQIAMPYILKVMGNYPLVDPEMTSVLVQNHILGDYDYSFNEHSKGVVYGMGCEVLNSNVLHELNSNKNLTLCQRNSGLLCLLQNKHWFKTLELEYERPRPNYKVCLENGNDLMLINEIFKSMSIPRIGPVIEFLDKHPVIAKSNHPEPTKEVGLEKLILFPEKIKSIQEGSTEKPDTFYPISVEISLTNRCNIDCLWCSDKDLRNRLPGELDIQVFKSTVRDLKEGGTKGIVIEGGGEPLLYKSFNEAIEYVHEIGLSCGLITNGTRKIDERLLRYFDWIRVSLDASNEKEYQKLKKSPLFETIINNISQYVKNCPVVGVGYVVTNQNCSTLEPLVLRLRRMGVSYIQFRSVIDHPELSSNVNLQYLMRYISVPKFNIIIDGIEENRINGNGAHRCKTHSLTSIITADGSVFLCGRLNIYSWFEPMGNLYDKSFKEMWSGEIRKKQAKMVLDKEFCKKYCPECRLTKFNVLFERLEKIKTRSFI